MKSNRLFAFLGTFGFMSVLFLALGYIVINIYLASNPWLYTATQEWKWYNYFTSTVGIAALYIKGWFWIIPFLLLAAIMSFVIVLIHTDLK